MEGWNKWCFGSGDKVRVKNTTKGAKCATDWMKLQFSVVGTRFSCFFQSSVPSKGGKKSSNIPDYTKWDIRAVGCNCRCCSYPQELPLELLLWTLQLHWFFLFFHFAVTSLSSLRLYSPLSLLLFTVFLASAPSLPHPPQTAVSAHDLSSLLLISFHGSYSLPPSIWLLLPSSVAECIPPPQKESIPAAWSQGPHHGVIHRGLVAAGWSYSCFGKIQELLSEKRSSDLDWICSKQTVWGEFTW